MHSFVHPSAENLLGGTGGMRPAAIAEVASFSDSQRFQDAPATARKASSVLTARHCISGRREHTGVALAPALSVRSPSLPVRRAAEC